MEHARRVRCLENSGCPLSACDFWKLLVHWLGECETRPLSCSKEEEHFGMD